MSWRVVAFGFLLTLSSTFGQTHFVSLFNAPLREDFGLSHGGIGALYSAATLGSAALLPWLGRLLDEIDLRVYTAAVMFGLAVAAVLLSLSESGWQLLAAFFMLRLFGQGLSSHTGMATTARLSLRSRGKSLSAAGLGMAAGEAVAPPLVAALLLIMTWREIWQAAAWVEVIVIMLLAQWLLFRLPHKPPATTAAAAENSWTRRQVLRDARFWLAVPSLFTPPFVVTALLFHQHDLAAFKEIDFRVWSSGIVAYSLMAVLMSLAAGVLVDKWSGKRVVKWHLAPLIASSLSPLFFDFAGLPLLYYALMGMTVGIGVPAINALWLEMYGAAHLGAIRALAQGMMVFFSAAGPVLYGVLLDAGVGWSWVLVLSAVWMVVVSVMLWLAPLESSRLSSD